MGQSFIPHHLLQKCGENLLAARGVDIDILDIRSGELITTWTLTTGKHDGSNDHQDEASKGTDTSTTEAIPPPAKRQKLSSDDEAIEPAESPQAENDGKAAKTKAKNRKRQPKQEQPVFVALIRTEDEQNVIGVSGEDKTIRVFGWNTHDGKRNLKQLSARAMPKRPSAIALSKSQDTILCADKFGDAWALPLHYSEEEDQARRALSSANQAGAETSAPQPYTPAASTLTVHSRRNLQALEYQKRHAATATPAIQDGPTFHKDLLLGHVSMLTDIAVLARGDREYIITADRDEHIRVSRGIPQAYVIETFLLGHTDFVTRLHIPRGLDHLLISGGGDGCLFTWDLSNEACLEPTGRVDLREHCDTSTTSSLTDTTAETPDGQKNVVISSIYSFPALSDSKDEVEHMLVLAEAMGALFHLTMSRSGALMWQETIALPCNPLAITDGPDRGSCIVSLDCVHEAGSRSTRSTDVRPCLLRCTCNGGKIAWEPLLTTEHTNYQASISIDAGLLDSALPGLLYPLESLRKQAGKQDEEM